MEANLELYVSLGTLILICASYIPLMAEKNIPVPYEHGLRNIHVSFYKCCSLFVGWE